MSRFTFYKGLADAAVGVILLIKPEVIYQSKLGVFLHKITGLRLTNPRPTDLDAISAQHSLYIMVIAVGLAHMRASYNKAALPPIALLNVLWASLALGTVVVAPQRATSTLLMTSINHIVFSSIMIWTTKLPLRELMFATRDPADAIAKNK